MRPCVRAVYVALTGNVSAEDIQQCKQAGIDDVIAKPASFPALHGALSRMPHTDGPPSALS